MCRNQFFFDSLWTRKWPTFYWGFLVFKLFHLSFFSFSYLFACDWSSTGLASSSKNKFRESMHNTEKLSHEVATRNFAPSFTIEFLSIFMHTSDATMPITLIWVSLERSFPPAERENRCQFWSKVMMSEVKQRPMLITACYSWHRNQWVNCAHIHMIT